MDRTVASSTPPASPRQPAWATATSLPSSAASTTGRQSAVSIASTTPGIEVTAASASGSASVGRGSCKAWSKRSTPVPCTWRSQCGVDGRAPSRQRVSRLAATTPGSSPLRAPKSKLSKGAAEAPAPWRSVVKARTPGGAGQSAASSAASVSIPGRCPDCFMVCFAPGGSAPLVLVPFAGVLAQDPQQLDHVRRYRRAHADRLAAERVREFQGLGVQGLAGKAAQALDQRLAGAARQLQRAAVERVADD